MPPFLLFSCGWVAFIGLEIVFFFQPAINRPARIADGLYEWYTFVLLSLFLVSCKIISLSLLFVVVFFAGQIQGVPREEGEYNVTIEVASGSNVARVVTLPVEIRKIYSALFVMYVIYQALQEKQMRTSMALVALLEPL